MKDTMEERVELYNTSDARPKKAPPLHYHNGMIYGVWFMGNNWKGSGYYGSYPPGYLKRINSLFPDIKPSETLHLFSGSLDSSQGMTVDINPDNNPDIVCNAEELSLNIPKKFSPNIIHADPPYSDNDAVRYGFPLAKRRVWMEECRKIMKPGGFLIIMDQSWPMYSKEKWIFHGVISIERSTNHRTRTVYIYERK